VSLIAFLSDFGYEDEFAGVCKGVIAGINPDAQVIDLTHGISPHDITAGALSLLRAVQYLPDEAVVLAVVDPGVGTDRKAIGVRTAERFFVGPDNGLLSLAVAMTGGALEAVVLDSPEHQLPSAGGSTFDGRDVFAPAAAFLAGGTPLTELGSLIDPSELMPLLLPLTDVRPDGGLQAQVLWVDRFGNAQLNAAPEELELMGGGLSGVVRVTVELLEESLRWVNAYGDGEEGEPVLIADAYGLLSIAVNRGRAADVLPLHTGAAVVLRPDPVERPGIVTPVMLRPRGDG
jgi:S-adenosylmethionine hydrolase